MGEASLMKPSIDVNVAVYAAYRYTWCVHSQVEDEQEDTQR